MSKKEQHRLRAVRRLGLMDTEPEERFDRICRVASHLMGTPVAYVSLLDDKKQFYKSAVGLGGMKETTLGDSFCTHTVQVGHSIYVPDATKDDRFRDNRYVVGPPNVRCYLGEPLRSSDGYVVGTFCVIDLEPRELDPTAIELCRDLAALAERELNLVTQLHLQRKLNELTSRLSHSLDSREVGSSLLQVIEDSVPSVCRSVSLFEGGELCPVAIEGEKTNGREATSLRMPILYGDRHLGELRLERECDQPFTDLERDLVKAFCFQMGLILENRQSLAHLVEQSRLVSLGSLAAGVAHEVNSPLGAARLNVDSIKRLVEPHQSRLGQKLDRLETSLKRAGDIIGNVLRYAGEGPEVSNDSELDLAVGETAGLLAHDLRQAGIRLDFRLDSQATVPLARNDLQQVVHHLLHNALLALASEDRSEKWIRVTSYRDEFGAHLLVEDNGPGVDPDLGERVFDPFVTTRQPGMGVGLGLSVSRQTVSAVGGSLKLRSRRQGACFVVTLPESR